MSKFLSELEDDLIELDVPVWKVALGGLFIVGLFWGSFFVFQKLTLWML